MTLYHCCVILFFLLYYIYDLYENFMFKHMKRSRSSHTTHILHSVPLYNASIYRPDYGSICELKREASVNKTVPIIILL
jgi:hypothetical protein